MRYFVILLAASLPLAAGCAGDAGESGQDPVVFVSVLPLADVVGQAAGEHARVESVVEPGHSPATYSISPRRMQELGGALAFFRVGVPFENRLVARLQERFPELRIVDLREGLDLLEMTPHDHSGHDHSGHDPGGHDHSGHDHSGHDHGRHDHGGLDPHVWLDPVRMKTMAETAASVLKEELPGAASGIDENLEVTLASLDSLNRDLASILSEVSGGTLYAFHPAYGYLADRYGLTQKAIQSEGKGPGMRSLQGLIGEMEEEGVEVIFVQPQFSKDEASAAADAVGAELVELNPLPEDYQEGMRRLARRIRDGLQGQGGS